MNENTRQTESTFIPAAVPLTERGKSAKPCKAKRPTEPCPICGKQMIRLSSPHGEYLRCIAFKGSSTVHRCDGKIDLQDERKQYIGSIPVRKKIKFKDMTDAQRARIIKKAPNRYSQWNRDGTKKLKKFKPMSKNHRAMLESLNLGLDLDTIDGQTANKAIGKFHKLTETEPNNETVIEAVKDFILRRLINCEYLVEHNRAV